MQYKLKYKHVVQSTARAVRNLSGPESKRSARPHGVRGGEGTTGRAKKGENLALKMSGYPDILFYSVDPSTQPKHPHERPSLLVSMRPPPTQGCSGIPFHAPHVWGTHGLAWGLVGGRRGYIQ